MVFFQIHDDQSEHVIYYLSKGLDGPELRYSHVEKLSLVVVFVVNRFRHYMMLRQSTVIASENPMRHILSHQFIGGKYSKWIMILQQFDLVFTAAKVKNSLVFVELLSDLPIVDPNETTHDPLLDEAIYLIDTTDPWYGDNLFYLQVQRFCLELSSNDHCHIHQKVRQCLVLNDTLNFHGAYIVIQHCLTHEEVKNILNYCHARACGGYIFGIFVAQKILCTGYYWPTLLKDCIEAIR